MILSQQVRGFERPNSSLEQYLTPPSVAANMILFAYNNSHIEGRKILDFCAGTGMLGIAATILGAEVTFIEKDLQAIKILKQNIKNLDTEYSPAIIHDDVFEFSFGSRYDTVVLNPPFGIQQKVKTDIDFVVQAGMAGEHIYSIHDGSPANITNLPNLLDQKNIITQGYFLDEFEISRTYHWHEKRIKKQKVMILYSLSGNFL